VSTVTAEVTLTIRVRVGDRWGDDCPLGQVLKQAYDSAKEALNQEAWKANSNDHFAIVGEPTIVIKTVQP
jgi:hypothetical protein